MEVLIVGGGIGGLTLGLMLHRAGIPSRIYEAAPEIRAVGVGINVLPHAGKELCALGLEEALSQVGVLTQESAFFTRFGQLIYREPAGRFAGYAWPQFSIHRGDLHQVLLDAYVARVGADRFLTGWRCTGADLDDAGVTALFEGREPQHGDVLVSCDGIHSVLRKQFHPGEGDPLYSGVNMWRGVTRWPPILTGASMIRIGWIERGKMVIYPIRNALDVDGNQLVNWTAELFTEKAKHHRDWNKPGSYDDFFWAFKDWHFDWLDAAAFLQRSEMVLEYPMVDQEPLPFWSVGRMTLLGDAAHPMVPRGSNGAGQAIIDCKVLTEALAATREPREALALYEKRRLPATTEVVLMNRKNPPDAILREAFIRSGDKPFHDIADVISRAELAALSDSYKRVAGYDKEALG
jgi:2-polyprenyl-6-methoxyphenol hydroxylase-like FAD-dependent oxidoreductase